MSSKTKASPAANGQPPAAQPRTRAALRAEIAALQRQARDEHEADKDREQRELAYLRSLLAHPAAESALEDARSLVDQTRGGGDEADNLVGFLVLVEAMKALREKAGVPE